jgi:membrane associated rhomboid family serine protease
MFRKKETTKAVKGSTLFLALLFAVFIAQVLQVMPPWGIRPRTPEGLLGIFFAPLLHGSWAHLTANAFPLWLTVIILFADKKYKPWRALFWIWLLSGFGTWLIGRSAGGAIHLGASGIIFGLISYLIASGITRKSWSAALVGALLLFGFGGIYYGVLPQEGVVSWEAHLAGAIVGTLLALKLH